MQYVGKVGGYVYNQWSSLNPATLLGAIDIIVVETPDGSLHCSPWHVRFGKFQIIKPLQKKIDLYVNDMKTDLPMKLGEGGEAFFVFESENNDLILSSAMTSPVISAASSPEASPSNSPPGLPRPTARESFLLDNEKLDLNAGPQLRPASPSRATSPSRSSVSADIESKIELSPSPAHTPRVSPSPSMQLKIAFERAKRLTKQLNIPSKVDVNGDMVLDMDGYKPNAQRNIDNSDELFQTIFMREINDLTGNTSSTTSDKNQHDPDAEGEYRLLDQIIVKDKDGNIRIVNHGDTGDLGEDMHEEDISLEGLMYPQELPSSSVERGDDRTYFKTLRLTSEQLQGMKLNYGENKLTFKLNQGNSMIESSLFLWKSTTPIVISDIDGTITKSDALGHVLNLFGRDWTHPGVANLFLDINKNGYNIMYLTARSVGQSDSTRQYLRGIVQDGTKLPPGPVILSPDRTMAALRREVILKKPEVFKMACLNDIRGLYYNVESEKDDRTPFYAGFGNRITDAISYRSVHIPSHRVFTINPNGEVHMELLELAGYKSLYLHIGELVDHFFPPIKRVSTTTAYNDNQFNQYIHNKQDASPPGSPRSIGSFEEIDDIKTDEKFNDVNYWRDPLYSLSDLSDEVEDEDMEEEPMDHTPSSPGLEIDGESTKKSRPLSGTFSSPLKSFMKFGNSSERTTKKKVAEYGANVDTPSRYSDREAQKFREKWADGNSDDDEEDDDDYVDDEDEDLDDDYTDDDYDEDAEDDYEDDYDETGEIEQPELEEIDELDFDDGIPPEEKERAQNAKGYSPDAQESEQLSENLRKEMEKLKVVEEIAGTKIA